jgi:hypothetical protein
MERFVFEGWTLTADELRVKLCDHVGILSSIAKMTLGPSHVYLRTPRRFIAFPRVERPGGISDVGVDWIEE